jgi:hypothetical protein
MNKLVYVYFSLFVTITHCLFAQNTIINAVDKALNELNESPLFNEKTIDTRKLIEIVEQLKQEHFIEINGTDSQVRPLIVTLQAVFEKVLSDQLKKNVSLLAGIILADTPPTPLFSTDDFKNSSIDEAVKNNPLSLSTIKARSQIIKNYLKEGGILYALYTRKGYERLTKEEQNQFKMMTEKFSTTLISKELAIDEIPAPLIGAIYYFSNSDLKTYAFAIQMPQSSTPEKMSSYKVYLGEIKEDVIEKRMNEIMQFINNENTNKNESIS